MFAALVTPIITEALIKEGRNHPQGTKNNRLPDIAHFSNSHVAAEVTKRCKVLSLLLQNKVLTCVCVIKYLLHFGKML